MTPIYVIIPVYNAEKYIEQAVNSVLEQKYETIKIVLVNDGSTDNSRNICDSLAQNYACVSVVHQENGGVSRARNAGIDYVLHENVQNAYIAFLDADDLWHPNFLQSDIVKDIQQQYDICAFGMITCNENAASFSVPQPYEKKNIAGGYSSIWTLQEHFAANLYHISLFQKWDIRFFAGYKYSEDKYFKVLCSFFAKDISFYPETMYIYREASGGAMSRSSTISATDYFLPIIEGWMRTQHVINQYSGLTGVTTDLGHNLGNVYLLDMICEHYMQQGSRAEIDQIVRQHPNYSFLQNMKPWNDKDVNYLRKDLYFRHPLFFAVKYRMKGVIRTMMRLALRLPFVQRLNHQRKYPLNYLP